MSGTTDPIAGFFENFAMKGVVGRLTGIDHAGDDFRNPARAFFIAGRFELVGEDEAFGISVQDDGGDRIAALKNEPRDGMAHLATELLILDLHFIDLKEGVKDSPLTDYVHLQEVVLAKYQVVERPLVYYGQVTGRGKRLDIALDLL